MAKKKRVVKATQRNHRRIQAGDSGYNPFGIDTFELTEPRRERAVKPLEAKNEAQGHYIISIETSKITFGTGPAGTGKTYVCGAMAVDMLQSHRVEKIVVSRPAVEAGEDFGFLPGELDEKYAPYLLPFMDVMHERMGRSATEYHLKRNNIETATLAHMRGRTFKNAFIILDEAQNVTKTQMKMFLTRIGPGCTVVVNGDLKQKDIPGESGLEDAVKRLQGVNGIKFVEFDVKDVVRSGIVQDIINRYES